MSSCRTRKGCELCSNPARMLCDSDEASLCWDCDERFHSASFLVDKHSRTLLCHVCQSPTPLKAAGPKLSPTVSVCHTCSSTHHPPQAASDEEDAYHPHQETESDDISQYEDFSEEEEENDDDDNNDDDEEDGQNQVVPWSTSASNCSTSEVINGSLSTSNSQRLRDSCFESEDEDECCSSPNFDSRLGTSELSCQL